MARQLHRFLSMQAEIRSIHGRHVCNERLPWPLNAVHRINCLVDLWRDIEGKLALVRSYDAWDFAALFTSEEEELPPELHKHYAQFMAAHMRPAAVSWLHLPGTVPDLMPEEPK
jgi:hypothetical protein